MATKNPDTTPWQIQMFQRSLKKQQKLKALLELTGDVRGKQCLLITCGDNNGALNWYFRSQGGTWTWADVSGENNDQVADLLGEPVLMLPATCFSIPDDAFDLVISIDVLEHLPEDQPFLHELKRVLKPDGRAVVTVPNGDKRLLANQIKWRIGMTPDVYGHTRAGYTSNELHEAVVEAGMVPVAAGGYSRFFTEMVELVINFGYVKVLSKKRAQPVPGHIAPISSGDIKKHGLAYRLYAAFFPLASAFSRLDVLLPKKTNHAVIVAAVKTEKVQ
jgi:2-polyprenyl-3-methyl-5-hydroxy-6-metoxy-1,4-benzoquinol methylase